MKEKYEAPRFEKELYHTDTIAKSGKREPYALNSNLDACAGSLCINDMSTSCRAGWSHFSLTVGGCLPPYTP